MFKQSRILLIAALSYLAIGGVQATEKLVIAATPTPQAEILEFVKPMLAKQGIALEIKIFTDYIQPAIQTNEKRVDGNFFLHQPYLNEFKKNHKGDIEVAVAKIHIEPLAAYSHQYKSSAQIPNGAVVAIPNDPSNSGRALLLLAQQGFIKLKDAHNISATQKDIIDNPKKLRFRELEAAMLPRVLNQVGLALINTNYAIEAKLDPLHDALFIEDGKSSPYANLLVAREDNKDSAKIAALITALQSTATKAFIQKKYKGAIIPAF
ncbi:MAG: MetQ/NlpA family ABC transporter substrate-binding protein [Ottowia sp.]|nr:MetQ/NlpA family ABC transporter substrate-binding protein [Ottowia sp.]